VLADDEAMIRAGIRAILDTDPELEVTAEAPDGRVAVDAEELRRAAPEVAVLILTTFGEDEYIDRALAGGAAGFLLKSGDPRELLAAVHAVAGGAAYLAPAVARRVITHLATARTGRSAEARRLVAQLTDREREVLALLGNGLSNAAIAARLFLVEGTVKAYVSSILTRLGVRNRVQAAIMAHEAGLL
jgi:DNA-binding NarL/FixJ family response regulator